jgi:hypothetical protein
VLSTGDVGLAITRIVEGGLSGTAAAGAAGGTAGAGAVSVRLLWLRRPTFYRRNERTSEPAKERTTEPIPWLCSVLSCPVVALRFDFLFAPQQEDEEEDALGLQLGLADLDSGSGLSPVLLAQQQAMLVSDKLTA